MAATDKRPFFLNLIKIRLPVAGFVSFLHRVSGLLMFLAMPLLVYLFDLSLQGDRGYQRTVEILQLPIIQLICLGVLWSIVHHLLAGIRFLFIDFDIGVEKKPANLFSWLVLALEAVIFIWLAVEIFL